MNEQPARPSSGANEPARPSSILVIALVLVAGAIGSLATPPTDWNFLVWPVLAAYAHLAFALPLPASRGRVGRFVVEMMPGIAFGFAINFIALRFIVPTITHFTSLPLPAALVALVLVALAQSLGWGVGSALARFLARRGVPRYLAFSAGAYFAMFFPSLFPWTVALGLTGSPVFLQLADIVGERGVTAIVALAAGLLAEGIAHAVKRRKKPAIVMTGLSFAIIALMFAEGTLRMRQVDRAREAAPHARLSLVQPGVNALARWDEKRAPELLAKLTALTKAGEARGTDLTVWPESAYPFPLLHAAKRTPPGDVAILGFGVRGPVMFGTFMRTMRVDGVQESFNSAAVAFGNGDISPPYDKRTLLWFGETVPLGDEIPWLRETFSRGTGLSPGEEVVRLDAGAIHAGVLICYEDTLISAGRDVMTVNPNLLVNLTNDAWFYGTSEGELHLRLSILRAIELRRDLARAVNLGPTGLVDAAGRIRVRYADALPAAVPVDVALLDGPPTIFARTGHAPFFAALFVACVLAIRRHKKTQPQNETTKTKKA